MSYKVVAILFTVFAQICGEQYNTQTFYINPHASREVFRSSYREFYVYNVGKPNLTIDIYNEAAAPIWGSASRSSSPAVSCVLAHGQGKSLTVRTKPYKYGVVVVRNNDDINGFFHGFSVRDGYPEYDDKDYEYFEIDKSQLAMTVVKVGAAYIPVVGPSLEGLIEFFWPPSEKNVWEQIDDKVETLINSKTQEAVERILEGDIKQLHRKIDLVKWEITDPTIKNTTTNHYMAIAQNIIGLETKFDFEYFLLPMYATVVNLKIKFYQFGLFNYKQIGLENEHILRLKRYIHDVVEDPKWGAVTHVYKICKKQWNHTMIHTYSENLFNAFASVQALCALNGYEHIPVWKNIAANPCNQTKPEIPVVVFSTHYGRASAQESARILDEPILPPLQPKIIDGRVNQPVRLRVFLTSNSLIGGIRVYYANGDEVTTGPTVEGSRYREVDFNGKKLMKLTARGEGQIDGLNLEFEDGRVYNIGKFVHAHRVFSLKQHHIVGFLLAPSDKFIDPNQAANIAVSYQIII